MDTANNPVSSARSKVKGVADICFLIDATGSMQPCIDDIKNNIQTFIDTLAKPDANGGVMLDDWRACICGYRDFIYEPSRGKEPIEMNNFTRDAEVLRSQLANLKAEGGGDEPESLLDALYAVVNRGKTGRGEQPQDDKWRYASDAARCIIVVTDASFHMNMATDGVAPGATLDDIVQLLQQERIRLSIFAPEMECHYMLSATDKCTYEAIEIPDPDAPHAAVQALRSFTSDKANFTRTLEMLAKSVSQSAAADIEL
ncbi:MAG: VWA domain-containing protein [Akkermansia sp.]|nr:VWA domain-containing protein [Akkermansia sp.]